MRRRWVGVTLAAAALLAACGAPDAGTVTDREHRPAWFSVISTGKTVVPIYHPESWRIQVTAGTEAGWTTVSHEIFDTCQIGATWTYDESAHDGRCSA